MKQRRAIVLGCGYVGLALTRALRDRGVEVIGTTRTPDRFAEIEREGATPMIADVMDPASLRTLAALRPHAVFDLVRPQRIDDRRYTAWGTANVAAAFADSPLDALVYLGSTSIHAPDTDDWMDETTPVEPASPVGRARAEAERIYLEHFAARGTPVRIARVPGIYGPGRTLRQRLETGAYRRLDDDTNWISWIHVRDLAEGLAAVWERGRNGEVYLLCDDRPTTGEEYAELTASLLSLPLPPAVERDDIRQESSSDTFERRIASGRCSNRRLREELRVELAFPTIHEGVPASLRDEGAL